MNKKSSAHYQREYRRRLREMGLVKKEVWILQENSKVLAKVEKTLREALDETAMEKGVLMTDLKKWTTSSLYEALSIDPMFDGKEASVELIGGAEPSIHIVMHEYGDLPLFMAVAGDQILVEAALWSKEEVADVAGFNNAILRTHKYFPLSTISLDVMGEDGEYYQMFGALSATSVLPNILLEIETLADNVIQAAEAYSEFLHTNQAAKR